MTRELDDFRLDDVVLLDLRLEKDLDLGQHVVTSIYVDAFKRDQRDTGTVS